MIALPEGPPAGASEQSSAAFRFQLIDVARGLAALSIIVWHYQFFFHPEPDVFSGAFAVERQPFFSFLRGFYVSGFAAVDLFFVISGFVFFHVYSTSIGDGSTSPGQFFLARFARLYPLHFATLLIMLFGQLLAQHLTGSCRLICRNNDTWHFILNIFFASSWGLERGFSYNAPIWSVSVEVLLYAVFFLFARVTRAYTGRLLPAICLMIAAGILMRQIGHKYEIAIIGQGLACFYIGGLVYQLWLYSHSNPSLRKPMAAAAVFVCVTATAAFSYGLMGSRTFPLIAFPGAILALAIFQSWWPTAGKSLRVIGDITYSTYLMHFPVQLLIVVSIHTWKIPVNFEQPLPFLVYFSSVVALAIVVHYGFELPAQQFVKRMARFRSARAPVEV
ncbi:MAG: acyltransferase [Hyphomicrobiaceae bacterium]